MKLKYYLRGLGIGIICTAIIMGIALPGKEKLTEAEIIERARLLGMVMPEEEEEKKVEEPQEIENDMPSEEEKIQTSQIPLVENEEQITPEAQVETPAAEPEMKMIEVMPGEYSDVVSRKLYEAGLIQDPEAFNKFLMDSGHDQNIMVGIHQIPVGSSEEDIVKILEQKSE